MQTTSRKIGDDGLIQRFQLAVWPDIAKTWRNVDEWPDTTAKNSAFEVFEKLDVLDATTVQAEGDDDELPFLRFIDAAQVRFDDWRKSLEHRLRSGDLHSLMEEHLSKFRGLIPSLALLIHLADGRSGPVGMEPLQKAIRWGEYLESHAYRIYSTATEADVAAAQELARRIVRGDLKDGFALRDVYRPG